MTSSKSAFHRKNNLFYYFHYFILFFILLRSSGVKAVAVAIPKETAATRKILFLIRFSFCISFVFDLFLATLGFCHSQYFSIIVLPASPIYTKNIYLTQVPQVSLHSWIQLPKTVTIISCNIGPKFVQS